MSGRMFALKAHITPIMHRDYVIRLIISNRQGTHARFRFHCPLIPFRTLFYRIHKLKRLRGSFARLEPHILLSANSGAERIRTFELFSRDRIAFGNTDSGAIQQDAVELRRLEDPDSTLNEQRVIQFSTITTKPSGINCTEKGSETVATCLKG